MYFIKSILYIYTSTKPNTMQNTKTTGMILVILGLILLGVSVYFIFNDESSNRMLLTYGIGTAMYTLGFYLRIKI